MYIVVFLQIKSVKKKRVLTKNKNGILSQVPLCCPTFESVDKILTCDRSNESY